MDTSCQVCGSSQWWDLPNPLEGRSVTTAGRIIEESLGKAHCARCGFVQRIHAGFLGLTDYYEQDYAKYYDRPGTNRFHLARYSAFGQWMASVLGERVPARVLDVGCGQGWEMEIMQSLYPASTVEGLEPSYYNSRIARQKGFTVHETRIGRHAARPNYDLVYSNNVIQHVTDARQFLAAVRKMVRPEGMIIITCPDGSVPNIELLWGDQNFSFLPNHLLSLSREAGFQTTRWFASPPSTSVPPAQMLLLSNHESNSSNPSTFDEPSANLEDIYRAKCAYLASFQLIDEHICSQLNGCTRVYNFGASYWASILAGYCPRYWSTVSACVVDDDAGLSGREFLGKPILTFHSLTPSSGAAIVLGTTTSAHKRLRARLSPDWPHVVSWEQFLSY